MMNRVPPHPPDAMPTLTSEGDRPTLKQHLSELGVALFEGDAIFGGTSAAQLREQDRCWIQAVLNGKSFQEPARVVHVGTGSDRDRLTVRCDWLRTPLHPECKEPPILTFSRESGDFFDPPSEGQTFGADFDEDMERREGIVGAVVGVTPMSLPCH